MDILGFTAAILPIAMSPGASFTMAVNNAVHDGFRGVTPVIAGTAAGIYIHAMLAGLGVTRLVAGSSPAMGALRICGTVYLFWLAIRMLKSGLTVVALRDVRAAPSSSVEMQPQPIC